MTILYRGDKAKIRSRKIFENNKLVLLTSTGGVVGCISRSSSGKFFFTLSGPQSVLRGHTPEMAVFIKTQVPISENTLQNTVKGSSSSTSSQWTLY